MPTTLAGVIDELEAKGVDLRKELGVSKQAISTWRTGSRRPRYETAEQIAVLAGRDIRDIYPRKARQTAGEHHGTG